MTLLNVIDTIKMFALKHPNINSAYEGNIYELMNANPQQKYASVVLTQQSHTQDDMYDHYGFNIFYIDRLVDDLEENRLQIQSTGKSMLSNIIKAFCEEFDAECDNISYQTFTERFVDECAGVYCTIVIDMVKDAYCTEKYWNESWVTPMIVVRNQDKSVEFTANGTYTIEYDATQYSGLGKVEVEVNVPDLNGSYDEGYEDGKNDGREESYNQGKQDGIEEGYSQGKTDGFNEGKAEGYTEGKTDGISEQKAKLEGITITENGTYTKEDGYNNIVVEIEDTNGSYDDGFSDGYDEGIEEGTSNAGAIIAETAQVLNITENGLYATKYTKLEDFGGEITGYFDDGAPFYGYAKLGNVLFQNPFDNSNISEEFNLEMWWKPDFTSTQNTNGVTGFVYQDYWNLYIKDGLICFYETGGQLLSKEFIFEDKWYHFVISKNDGFVINGVKVGDLSDVTYGSKRSNIYINTSSWTSPIGCANGYYGMIRCNGEVFIPTNDGFLNYTTNIPLLRQDGKLPEYLYQEYERIFNGNLIKTVNVNVIPKINIQKEGFTFSYSNIVEVPEWVDWEGITNMDRMFFLSRFKELPMIDTSNVTSMEYMCSYSDRITTIPQYDTRNVTNVREMLDSCSSLLSIPLLNTSNVTNFSNFVYNCSKLASFPPIDTSNATDIGGMFGSCNSLTTIPPLNAGKVTNTGSFFGYSELKNLTNFGGLIGLKASMNNDYGFKKTPNLTYESCINVLNGLYDFVGNNVTPTSSQGKLKVHANFLTTVGDDINIGIQKGWIITSA